MSVSEDEHSTGMGVIILADLIRAYEDTNYCVSAATDMMILRIGHPFNGLDGVIGLSRLAIVTAFNPFSRTQAQSINEENQARLIGSVESEGLEWLSAYGEDPTGEWPPEPSLAVLNPTDAQLDQWMEMFGQNAVVIAECGGVAALRLHPRHIKSRRS